jgi:peptidoglycan/LPS O-acetylase OafA/YrhL
MYDLFRVNNFDIIRLLAALQVANHHIMLHLKIEYTSLAAASILSYFPGVPIFFFVSGFLISKSYENNTSIKGYASNRILRIYPALIVCTFAALFSIYLTGYLKDRDINAVELGIWVLGQISFFQFYNPEFMREFGTGVMNGSLWTISVELQFYVMAPIVYSVLGLLKSNTAKTNYYLLVMIFVFMLFHIGEFGFKQEYGENLLFKLYGVSFVPWIWMFLVGVLFQRNFVILHRILSRKAVYILPFYLAISFYLTTYLGWSTGNGINPVLYILLSVLVFSFAYSFPVLSRNILRGNDISYGLYIYHVPVVNILIYYGYTSKSLYASIALIIAVIIAVFSWFIIEKNSIKLKKHPTNSLNTASKAIGSDC